MCVCVCDSVCVCEYVCVCVVCVYLCVGTCGVCVCVSVYVCKFVFRYSGSIIMKKQ